MKKKRKVVIATLTMFILTMIVSTVGYYVFAASSTIPTTSSFKLKVEISNIEKSDYAPKEYVDLKCTLTIPKYQVDKSKMSQQYKDFKMIFDSTKAISNKDVAENTIDPGKVIYCEKEKSILGFNKGTVEEKVDNKGVSSTIRVFEETSYVFYISLKVNDLGKDLDGKSITSMDVTKSIFDNAKLKFTLTDEKSYELDFATATNNVKFTVKDGAAYVPDISAHYVGASPTESVLDEKVQVKYQIDAKDFIPPVINIAGKETIIVVENSHANNIQGGTTTILNSVVNNIVTSPDRKPDDKLGLITCATGPTGGEGEVYTFKIAPKEGSVDGVSKITAEDINNLDLSDPYNPKFRYIHDLVDNKLFRDFSEQVLDQQYPTSANYEGKHYGYVNYSGLNLKGTWSSTKRNIAGGLSAAVDLLKSKGDPSCSKNIIFIGSGLITADEKAEILKLNLEQNNVNVYTIQAQPMKVNGYENGDYFSDSSMEDLHYSLGGGFKTFYRNYENANDLQNFLMATVSQNISNANPPKYEFTSFKLRFDLGDNFGLNPQISTISDTLPAYYNTEKIKTILVTDYKLEATLENEKYVPYWYKKDKDGNWKKADNEEISVEFSVYPKKVSPPVKIPLTFKDKGSTIAYKDIYGKDVVGLIGQPSIVVIDPADPRIHGLDNGVDSDGNIMIEAGSASISGSTNATILAYAQIYAKDVSIELDIDTDLKTITHVPRLYYYRDGKYVDTGVDVALTEPTPEKPKALYRVDSMPVYPTLIDGMPDPRSWVRGDIVVLKYTVMVPSWIGEVVNYNNNVKFHRDVKGLEPFNGVAPFKLSSADLPDLF